MASGPCATVASYSAAAIERIALGLRDRTLPKSEWTHAAHFAAALWLLQRYGPGTQTLMPPLIRAYNESTGVSNTDTSGYHETITLASLRAGQDWLSRHPGVDLPVVLAELLASPFGRSDWLLSYWTQGTLFSARARREWVEPDLRALPF